jgi:hypothetical protein
VRGDYAKDETGCDADKQIFVAVVVIAVVIAAGRRAQMVATIIDDAVIVPIAARNIFAAPPMTPFIAIIPASFIIAVAIGIAFMTILASIAASVPTVVSPIPSIVAITSTIIVAMSSVAAGVIARISVIRRMVACSGRWRCCDRHRPGKAKRHERRERH